MATLQEEREQYALIFGDECCSYTPQLTQEEYLDSISECQAMLHYAIDLQDKAEIAYWRKMLQEAKINLRNLKRSMTV